MKIKVNLDEIPDFVSVAPGKHRARLEECDEDVSQAGNDMLVWGWKVIEGEEEGRTIRSYTSLLEDALGGLKTHFAAFGYTEGIADVDTDDFIGKTALLVVTKHKYRDRDSGDEKEGTSVANVLPDEKSPSGKGKRKASAVSRGDGDPDELPF